LGKRRRAALVEMVYREQPAVAVEHGKLFLSRQTLAFTPPAEMLEPPFRHCALPGLELEEYPEMNSTLQVVGFLVERGDQTVDAAAAQDQRELRPARRQLADRTRQINVPNLPSGVVVVQHV